MLPRSRLLRLSSLLCSRFLPNKVNEIHSGVGLHRGTQNVTLFEEEFRASGEKLATLQEPRRDVKVQLYALFHQATVGKCDIVRPQTLDIASKAKWYAWNQLQCMPKEEAMRLYIELVDSMATCSDTSKTVSTRSALRAAVLEDWSNHLRIRKSGHVIYIRFNRPDKRNALTLQMYDDIALTLENAAEDEDVYLVVFTGTGDCFCSGNDLNNLTSIDPENIVAQTGEIKAIIKRQIDCLLTWNKTFSECDSKDACRDLGLTISLTQTNFVQSFIDFPKPLIALVNGPAVGIAVSLLGLFDAVYAIDTATFQTPFLQLGQCPVGCSSYVFPRIMGSAKAGEMLLFNRKLTAQGAHDRNLVNQVFPEDIFHRETQALIQHFATLPPQGLQVAKNLLRKSEQDKLHQVNEEECESLLDRWKSEECWNAVLSHSVIPQGEQTKMDDV